MIKSMPDKLSQEKIQQLLAAVGAKSQEDQSHLAETGDYDWRQPRYFNFEQVQKIETFFQKIVAESIKAFSRLYQDNCSISCVKTRQRFLGQLQEQTEQENYYIPFGSDSKNAIGFLCVPKLTALNWTARVLGLAEKADGPTRCLSKLEESFLLDIVSEVIQVFAKLYGSDLFSGNVTSEMEMIELRGSEELFEIMFEVRGGDSEEANGNASIVICCDKLESVVQETKTERKTLSEAEITNVIREHVHHVPVSVHVELGTAVLPFKDVMDLQVNDIVALDKNISEPMDIFVEGRPLFKGRPAQSDGKYAFVIV